MTELRTYKINLKRQFIRKNTNTYKHKWYKFRRKINGMTKVARRIANFSISPENKYSKLTSKDVKHLGTLKSTISNQIIRKYKNDKKCKKISRVNLIIPANSTQEYGSVRHNEEKGTLYIVPLKLTLKWKNPVKYTKINQIELNTRYAYISLTIQENKERKYKNIVGVDLNIKHNLATVGNNDTKKATFLGKDFIYRRVKYKEIRRRFQKQEKNRHIKRMGNKEHRVMNDLNHKIAKKIIELAIKNKANIAFEKLSDIRTGAKVSKGFRYFLNSWQFYTLQCFVEYKAKMEGVKVVYIDPKYTSQICSSCSEINKCKSKKYICGKCGLHIHRDTNASYNIAVRGSQAL